MNRSPNRDRGFTLPELLISVVLMALIASVVTMAIITSIRTAPNVTSRADSAIAIQGITTFLPPDVDSTEPDGFDIDPGTASGCAGADPGVNIVRMTWEEEFFGNTTTFVANYRFVTDAFGGVIKRVTCSGQFALGPPSLTNMSAKLSTTTPTVVLYDSDGDGNDDQLKITIETLSGGLVYIDAASKNPSETLPPVVTSPTTTTTSTTTTIAANTPPVANPTSGSVNASTLTTFTLAASDADPGDVLSASVSSVPAGWTVTTSGINVDVTASGASPGTYNLGYTVSDLAGATATSTLTIDVVTTTVTTTTTTSTTSTTTTTLPPPCVVSSVSVSSSTVNLKSSDPSKLKRDVQVVANGVSGYCVGLTLQYVTGAPNGQYVQNLGNAAPYSVSLLGHPHGTELWSVGTHTLEVRDGSDNLLASTTLTVIPK